MFLSIKTEIAFSVIPKNLAFYYQIKFCYPTRDNYILSLKYVVYGGNHAFEGFIYGNITYDL
jgi:hypothetical protein